MARRGGCGAGLLLVCGLFLVGVIGGAINSVRLENEEKKAEKYHTNMKAALSDTSDFQVTGEKAVSCVSGEYNTWYVPEGYAAETPEEVRYIIRTKSGEELVGHYTDGTGAYQHWVDVTVEDLATGQISGPKGFWGPEPPQSKSSDNAYHSYPDKKDILAWVQSVMEGTAVKNQPIEETTAATEAPETQPSAQQLENEAALEAAIHELNYDHGESPTTLSLYLESEGFSAKAAAYAVENCGADWMEEAVKAGAFALEHYDFIDDAEALIWDLVQSDFTQEQAEYAASVLFTQEQNVVTVHARVPAGWNEPGCWAWSSETGEDVYDFWPGRTMGITGNWYTIDLPSWVDYVVINANDGSAQTVDLPVEKGRDVWLLVYAPDDVGVFYEEPTE